MRQTSSRKGFQEEGNESASIPTPTFRNTQKHQVHNHNIYADDLPQTQRGAAIVASVPVSPHEHCLVDLLI